MRVTFETALMQATLDGVQVHDEYTEGQLVLFKVEGALGVLTCQRPKGAKGNAWSVYGPLSLNVCRRKNLSKGAALELAAELVTPLI